MRFCFRPVFLLVLLLIPLHSHAAELLLPASSVSPASADSDKTTYLDAQEVEGKKGEQIEANGSVELQQGTQKIFADHVLYEQDTSNVTANGSVRVEQPTSTVVGPSLKMNTATHIGEMPSPAFEQLKDSQVTAHGTAQLMHSTGPTYTIYDHASYTTCPAGNNDWLLHMSEFDMDRSAQVGTAHNAWIEFESVPILYTPWLTFPLDGARHSGVLAPTYANTTAGGVELTIPLYWNIAPNYDYTISVRDMTTRGVMLENEFRFIEPGASGNVIYEEINNDHIANMSRSHLTLNEKQNYGGGVTSEVSLNQVSDDNYFRDLAVSLADVTQTQLLNQGTLSYASGGLSASVVAQTYQTLQDPTNDVAIPYQRMPQINLSYQKTINDAAISVVNELVDFRHPTQVDGQRMVLYPSVTYSLLNDPGFYLKPKLGVNYTQYAMQDNNTGNIPNASRTIPIFSLDSGMTFERDMNLGQSEYVQTMEPRIYYVKIPYQNQDILPVYDTSQAPLSFAQMFSENRFYGNDRIGDADMVTAGLTTRLIDGEGGIERLHIGVAEQYYFSLPQVNLVGPATSPKSDILLSIGGKITNKLTLDSFFDYNPNESYTPTGNVSLVYRPEIGKLLNLGYSFTQDPVTPTNDVRQADFSAQWPLTSRWDAISRISYSLEQNLMTERLLGLEYNRTCWMLRFVAEKFWYSAIQSSSGMFIQLELNDLVAIGSNPLSELKTQIPGYTKMNDSKLLPSSTPAQVSP